MGRGEEEKERGREEGEEGEKKEKKERRANRLGEGRVERACG